MVEAAVRAAFARANAPSGAVEKRLAGFEDFENSRNGGPGRATYFSFEALSGFTVRFRLLGPHARLQWPQG
jgi:hypothetical protein